MESEINYEHYGGSPGDDKAKAAARGGYLGDVDIGLEGGMNLEGVGGMEMGSAEGEDERDEREGQEEGEDQEEQEEEDEDDEEEEEQPEEFANPSGAFANVGQGLEGKYKNLMMQYWQDTINSIERDEYDFKNHQLPLARIKKVMKTDEEVKMISAEAPILFAKGCDIFITELTMRAWIHAEENKRRTLQKSDIAAALQKSDMFDFLIDIVPREEDKPKKKHSHHPRKREQAAPGTASSSSAASHPTEQYLYQQQYIDQVYPPSQYYQGSSGSAQPAHAPHQGPSAAPQAAPQPAAQGTSQDASVKQEDDKYLAGGYNY